MPISQLNPAGFSSLIPSLLKIQPPSVVAQTSLRPTLMCLNFVVLDAESENNNCLDADKYTVLWFKYLPHFHLPIKTV